MLKEIGVKVDPPVTIYTDSKYAIQIVANPVFHERTKHIKTNCNFIKEKIQQGIVRTEYIKTTDQQADIITKGLCKAQHQHLCSKLGLLNIFVPPILRRCIE